MKAHLFCIECLTNLHVGSGESNYNIIDNEVERDPVLANVPVIHASGVKGALRAHCKGEPWEKEIFGEASDPSKSSFGGTYKFFTANLLVRPLRVSDESWNASYVLTTTQEIVDKLENLAKGLGAAVQIPTEKKGKITAEGETLDWFERGKTEAMKTLFGESKIALAKSFEPFDLPSLARNSLDDKGISNNLWYEEIVPYTSRFYFFVLAPDEFELDGGKKFKFTEFSEKLEKDTVQFGGNASVGYGYCRVREVKLP